MKDFVDGCAMGLGENVPILGLGVEFGGMLFEGNRFDGFGLLEGEGVAVIVVLFVLSVGLPGASRLVEANLFRILIRLSLNPTTSIILMTPDFNFQIADHPTITIIILNLTQ